MKKIKPKHTPIYGNEYDKKADDMMEELGGDIVHMCELASEYIILKDTAEELKGFEEIEEKAKKKRDEARSNLMEAMRGVDAGIGVFNRYIEDNKKNFGHPEMWPLMESDSITIFGGLINNLFGDDDD